jgi:ABC-2 type transport system ATP-binding protein
MLEAIGLTKCYASIPAVSHVSFAVRPGEILGYLGPNGSGKSTTVKMLTGLMEPTRGKVLFHGSNIKDDLPGYKKILGYVPEEALLYRYMTGWEISGIRGHSARDGPLRDDDPRSRILVFEEAPDTPFELLFLSGH